MASQLINLPIETDAAGRFEFDPPLQIHRRTWWRRLFSRSGTRYLRRLAVRCTSPAISVTRA